MLHTMFCSDSGNALRVCRNGTEAGVGSQVSLAKAVVYSRGTSKRLPGVELEFTLTKESTQG